MTLLRLVRLRRDAVDWGVFPGSVRPQVTHEGSRSLVSSEHSSSSQHVSSAASCSAAQGHTSDVLQLQESATGLGVAAARKNASIQPTLHQCPRYIYGDVYAPVYQPRPEFEARKSSKHPAKQRASMRNSGGKCKNCAENAGWSCIRLAPSSTGVDFAREVLIGRALNGWPARRFRRTSFARRPSPLRTTFTSDFHYPKVELPGLEAAGNLSSPTTSSDTLVDMEESLMSLVEDAEFSEIVNNALFSPDFARRNASCIFDDVNKPLLLSTVCSSLGNGAGSEGGSELPLTLDDLPEIEDEGVQLGVSQPVWPRRRVSFAELPSIQHSQVVEPRPGKRDSLVNRVAKAGLKRLRSLKSESLGKKLRRIN